MYPKSNALLFSKSIFIRGARFDDGIVESGGKAYGLPERAESRCVMVERGLERRLDGLGGVINSRELEESSGEVYMYNGRSTYCWP